MNPRGPGDLVAHLLDLDTEPSGHGAGVLRAKGTIADIRHDGGNRLQCPDPALGTGQIEPVQGGAHGELEHRHGILDEGDNGGVPPGLAQLAGVLA